MNRKTASITGSAVALVGLGVAGGIALAGSGSTPPAQQTVQVDNQTTPSPTAPTAPVTKVARPADITVSSAAQSTPAAAPTEASMTPDPSTSATTPSDLGPTAQGSTDAGGVFRAPPLQPPVQPTPPPIKAFPQPSSSSSN